jgi:hypothetical protein
MAGVCETGCARITLHLQHLPDSADGVDSMLRRGGGDASGGRGGDGVGGEHCLDAPSKEACYQRCSDLPDCLQVLALPRNAQRATQRPPL